MIRIGMLKSFSLSLAVPCLLFFFSPCEDSWQARGEIRILDKVPAFDKAEMLLLVTVDFLISNELSATAGSAVIVASPKLFGKAKDFVIFSAEPIHSFGVLLGHVEQLLALSIVIIRCARNKH